MQLFLFVFTVLAAQTGSFPGSSTESVDLMSADTPELFLEALASATPEGWVESMTQHDPQFPEDSVRIQIDSFRELSVEPGSRTLVDFDGGYRAVFPESRWTWRLEEGRIGSVVDTTVVEWRPGGYRWVSVPLFNDQGATVGPRETLCMGVISMAAVLLIAVFGVWYAKRRYG